MFDEFPYLHPEIVLDQRTYTLTDPQFDKAVAATKHEPFPVNLSLLANVFDPEFIRHHLELHNWKNFKLVDSTHHRTAIPTGRLLCEIIILAKTRVYFPQSENEPQVHSLTRVVLGCMSQHRLTQLLLQLDEASAERVFNIGKLEGMNQGSWESDFIGAATCVRVIKTLSACQNTRIYMPLLREDTNNGVDVFARTPKHLLSISVRTTSLLQHLDPCMILSLPHPDDRSPLADEQRRIFRGTKTLREKYGSKLVPCYIRAGKPREQAYRLDVRPGDVEIAESFLSAVEHTATRL